MFGQALFGVSYFGVPDNSSSLESAMTFGPFYRHEIPQNLQAAVHDRFTGDAVDLSDKTVTFKFKYGDGMPTFTGLVTVTNDTAGLINITWPNLASTGPMACEVYVSEGGQSQVASEFYVQVVEPLVNIDDALPEDPVDVNEPPVAAFTATQTGPLSVGVNASGSYDPDGTIVAYSWDFGDGQTGTGATASHTYATAGTYTITLTVTDDDGATSSTTRSVTLASSIISPPSIATARGVWWATDLIEHADGDALNTWTSRVNGVSVYASGANRPTLVMTGVNSQPGVLFDGVDDFMSHTAPDAISTSASGCVVAVVRLADLLGLKYIWSSADVNNTGHIAGATSDRQMLFRQRTGSGSLNATSVGYYGGSYVDTAYVLEWSSDGATWSKRSNNVVAMSGITPGDWFGDTASRDNFTMGTLLTSVATGYMSGYIAFLGVFDAPLSAGDRSALYGWIADYYGIGGSVGIPATSYDGGNYDSGNWS